MAKVITRSEPPPAWREVRARTKHRVLVPFHALNWGFSHIAYFLSLWSFLEVLEYAGSLSVLVAVIFWIAGAGDRRQMGHYEAWQVINTAQGKGGNGGRIDALQELAADEVSLIAVDLSGAYLQNVQLARAQLHRADFSGADLRGARFDGADLSQALFRGANLRDAALRSANVQYVDFSNADLVGIDLGGLTNWIHIASIKNANIRDIQNPPAGFIDWALAHGANRAPD